MDNWNLLEAFQLRVVLLRTELCGKCVSAFVTALYSLFRWWQVSCRSWRTICLKSDPGERIGPRWHGALPVKHQLHQVLHPFCPPFFPSCHQLPRRWRVHLHRMVVYRHTHTNCDHGCQKDSDSNRGRRPRHWRCCAARSVCQSVTDWSLLARHRRRLGPWPSQQRAHTSHTHTPLDIHQNHRVHLKFDRQGHTRAVGA